MNCKQGDLAIVIRSVAGNEGLIFRCVRFDPDHQFTKPGGGIFSAPAWELDRYFITWDGGRNNFSPDDCLRPIRDPGDSAVDEMLLLVGSPTKETA